MSRALLSDIFRSIRRSASRFISMILIVALGAGFFVGMKCTGPSMKKTCDDYVVNNNLLDLKVQCSLGITADDIAKISQIEDIDYVQGEKFVDALVLVNGKPEIDIDGAQISTRVYGIDVNKMANFMAGVDDNSFVNRPTLIEGNFPTTYNECLVDKSSLSTPDDYQIGNIISLQEDSNTDLSGISYKEFKIVGIIETPYYISYERGNTLVGSGKLGTFIYVPNESFTSDYFSEAYVTLKDSDKYDTQSDEYGEYVDDVVAKIQKVADSSILDRTKQLKIELPKQISDAKKKYATQSASATKQLDEAKKKIDQLQGYVDDPEGSYNKVASEVANSLGLASNAFNQGNSEYQNALSKYNTMLEQYKAASEANDKSKEALATAQEAVDKLQSSIQSMQNTVSTTRGMIEQTENLVSSAENVMSALQQQQSGQMSSSQLSGVIQSLQAINPELYDAIVGMTATGLGSEAMNMVQPYLIQQKEQLSSYKKKLDGQEAKIKEYNTQLAAAQATLMEKQQLQQAASQALDAIYEQLNKVYDTLSGTKDKLTVGQVELMMKQSQATAQLEQFKSVIQNAPATLQKAKQEYETKSAEVKSQLSLAESKIKSSEKILKNIQNVKWNITNRNELPGFSSYSNTIKSMNDLSNIFPLIFFIVAALVCFTTMTRMVEEERTQQGTLKALGYSNAVISTKYIVYAIFASLIGATIGIIIGIFALPSAIFKAYTIMFAMPSLEFDFSVKYILVGLTISVLTTLLAAVLVCIKQLNVNTAVLMRPKAPKPGKRVFLEKIKFIWKRISFSGKVTIRNLFRRKSKMFMTILGIAGCMSLILGSTGLYTSINNLMDKQYSAANGITRYDVMFAFSDPQDEDSEMMNILKSDARVTDIIRTSLSSTNGGKTENDLNSETYILVPEANDLTAYINLIDYKTKQPLTLDDSGAIVTEKFAKDNDIAPGDDVFVKISDDKVVKLKVSSIAENYTFNYIYLTQNMYKTSVGEDALFGYALSNLDDAVMADSNTKSTFATDLMRYNSINAVSFASDTADTLNNVIGVLSVVVMIFIACAALLAVIVLYNLNNINVSERKRELATLRVLGFRDGEMASYIYRENIILVLIGLIFGVAGGIGVHKLLIKYCAVDAVMFVQMMPWYVYLISIVITVLFAVLSNILMSNKVKKIDMVESLKSIE